MTLSVDQIINKIIGEEGGFSDNPEDPGRATKYGITQTTLSNYLGRPATIQDVKDLTVETARLIYTQNFYIKPGFAMLNANLQPVLVDAGVLSGPQRAIMFLETAINQNDYGPVVVDGILGQDDAIFSDTAYAAIGPKLINDIVDERIAFYNAIVKKNPGENEFLKGWIDRADTFRVSTGGWFSHII